MTSAGPIERDGKPGPGRAHTWDKRTGRYRVEWTAQAAENSFQTESLNIVCSSDHFLVERASL